MIQVISSNGTQYNTGKIFIFDKYGKLKSSSGGSASWGSITGTLSSQTDLQSALNAKQDTLVSGTNIKTINGNSVLGSGDLTITGGIPKGTASGTDTYTTTITGVTSYVDGNAYLIRFTNGNTTGATLNINSLGAVTLYRNNDGPIVPGDILDGAEMLCVYNSTTPSFQCIGTSPNTMLTYVTNDDTVTITKGQPVYASGGVGDRLKVKRAYNTSDATSAQTIGLVFSTSIAAGQKGIIITQGLLTGLSILPTSTWADSDPVYLGPTAGTITPTKPYAPNHLVYLGFVTTASNGSAGRLYVRVQNGYELDELHNVQAHTPTLKDTLYYDNTVSPAQWKTASIATILGYTPQEQLTLTTTGSGGSATLVGSTLNIPNYSAASNIGKTILGGSGSITLLGSGATYFASIIGIFIATGSDALTRTYLRSAGQMTYASVFFSTAFTGSCVCTLMVSGAATAMTFTIAAGSAAGVYPTMGTSLTSVSIADTDYVSFRMAQSGGSGGTIRSSSFVFVNT